MEVLEEYDLISHNKVGYFVLDNASNDSRVIEELGRKLQWRDPAGRMIRCFGHILHLVARVMLFVNDGNTLKALCYLIGQALGSRRRLVPMARDPNVLACDGSASK